MFENVGASTSRNPNGLHGLYGDNFTFTIYKIKHIFSNLILVSIHLVALKVYATDGHLMRV
jgi:hypothetical protein